MIKVVAKGNFIEGKIEEAIKLYEELVDKTRKEYGCISYNLYQDKLNHSILTVIEEWESEEALENHKNTEHFTRIVPLLGSLRNSSELNIYKLLF